MPKTSKQDANPHRYFRLDPENYNRIQKLAREDCRSAPDYIRMIVLKHLREFCPECDAHKLNCTCNNISK